jgi:hypothetical protein
VIEGADSASIAGAVVTVNVPVQPRATFITSCWTCCLIEGTGHSTVSAFAFIGCKIQKRSKLDRLGHCTIELWAITPRPIKSLGV